MFIPAILLHSLVLILGTAHSVTAAPLDTNAIQGPVRRSVGAISQSDVGASAKCLRKKHPFMQQETDASEPQVLRTSRIDGVAGESLSVEDASAHGSEAAGMWLTPEPGLIQRKLKAVYHFSCPIKHRNEGTFVFGAYHRRGVGFFTTAWQNIDEIVESHFDHNTGAYGYVWKYTWCDQVGNFECWYTASGHVDGVFSNGGLSIELYVAGEDHARLPNVHESCTPLGRVPAAIGATCIVQRVDISVPPGPPATVSEEEA